MGPGDLIANRFELIVQAGSGGMGKVFRGVDRETDRPVAVKFLHDEVRRDTKRFDLEASVLAGFNHPAIVRHVAHGRTMMGAHYIVMEWVDGQTLAQRMDEEGLTMAEAVETVARVSSGIALSHRMGIVHRDIKPSNILFPERAVSLVKVIDFGIALRTQVSVRFTESGTVLGTPSYMAPEQARASKAVDARTDVFALGCVLYECVTGQVAFAGSNPLAVRAKALVMMPAEPSELVKGVPPALDDLIMRMLAKEPDDRPAHAGVVWEDLQKLSQLPNEVRVRHLADNQQTQRVTGRPGGGAATGAPSMVSVILAAVPEEYARVAKDGELQPADLLAELAALAQPYNARVELLDGQSYMVIVEGGGTVLERASMAGRCALAIRDAQPSLALVLSIGDEDNLHEAIDRGARTMEVAVRRAILKRGLGPGKASAGAIRLDRFGAGMLGAEFEVSRAGSKTYYLDGLRTQAE